MIKISGYNIELSKGDDFDVYLNFYDEDTLLDKVVYASDTILFTIKETLNSVTKIYSAPLIGDGTSLIRVQITGEVTDTFKVGSYYYDVRVLYNDGTVYTPIKPAIFKVAAAIGEPY